MKNEDIKLLSIGALEVIERVKLSLRGVEEGVRVDRRNINFHRGRGDRVDHYILNSRVLTFMAIAATTRGRLVPSLFNGFLAVIFLLTLLIIVIVLVEKTSPLPHFQVPLSLRYFLVLVWSERVFLVRTSWVPIFLRHRPDVPFVFSGVFTKVNLFLALVESVVVSLSFLLLFDHFHAFLCAL